MAAKACGGTSFKKLVGGKVGGASFCDLN